MMAMGSTGGLGLKVIWMTPSMNLPFLICLHIHKESPFELKKSSMLTGLLIHHSMTENILQTLSKALGNDQI